MRFKYKDFSFRIFPHRFPLEAWQAYYSIKNSNPHIRSDYNKMWLKLVRSKFRESNYKVTVVHKSTGKTQSHVVQKINRKLLIEQLITHVRALRKANRRLWPVRKDYCGADYFTTGGCFEKNDEVKKLAHNPFWHDPTRIKVPKSKSINYIGVELEFNTKGSYYTDDIAGALKNAGLGRFVHVGTDPSCGFEVRCLLHETNWLEPLTSILKVLTDMGFTADARCGTHVHLDMRNRDIIRVYKNMFFTQTFLRKFLTKERKRNRYCLRNTKDVYDPQEKVRYMGINTQSYQKHRTIEVRMHHGTLDIEELAPWINLLLKVVNFNGEINKKVLTLKQAKGIFNLEEPLADVLGKRLNALFKRPPTPPVTAEEASRTRIEQLRAALDRLTLADSPILAVRDSNNV